MDSGNLFRFVRAVLAGNFDSAVPRRRSRPTYAELAMLLAGAASGIILGLLIAPSSGAELKSNRGKGARDRIPPDRVRYTGVEAQSPKAALSSERRAGPVEEKSSAS
jgi:hypothetical protein